MNYQQLKQDDPGGTVDEALTTLRAMTVEVALTERMITVRAVAAVHGMAVAESIRSKIEGNSPAVFPAWVLEAFGPNGSGLDVCSPVTQAEIAAVTPAIFSAEERDVLLSMATEMRPKYTGLRAGHVEHARTI